MLFRSVFFVGAAETVGDFVESTVGALESDAGGLVCDFVGATVALKFDPSVGALVVTVVGAAVGPTVFSADATTTTMANTMVTIDKNLMVGSCW